MADTLLTDLHVRYIQNLGKVSWIVIFKANDTFLSLLNGGAVRRGVRACSIRMT